MNPGEGYRLLNLGEQLVGGDEYFSPSSERWEKSLDAGLCVDAGDFPYRRKLPAPSGWVSVKERLPKKADFPIAVTAYDGGGGDPDVSVLPFSSNYLTPEIFAWKSLAPLPPPPAPPKSDAEIAWERFNEKPQSAPLGPKDYFIAGFNAEVAK